MYEFVNSLALRVGAFACGHDSGPVLLTDLLLPNKTYHLFLVLIGFHLINIALGLWNRRWSSLWLLLTGTFSAIIPSLFLQNCKSPINVFETVCRTGTVISGMITVYLLFAIIRRTRTPSGDDLGPSSSEFGPV